jgi:hypothetical protein
MPPPDIGPLIVSLGGAGGGNRCFSGLAAGGHSVKLRDALTGGLIAILGFLAVTVPGTYAADVAKPSISKEAAEDLLRMGQTLRVEEFSFEAKTIRVYADPNGEPLHIFHTMRVTVHRPSRLLVDVNGDDGSTKTKAMNGAPDAFWHIRQ